jgi:hypothetical protein
VGIASDHAEDEGGGFRVLIGHVFTVSQGADAALTTADG